MGGDELKLPREGRTRGLKPLLFGGIALAAVAGAVVAVRIYVFPREFVPVTLRSGEERALAAKLERLDPGGVGAESGRTDAAPGALEPERYTEAGAERRVRLTQREVNALLAKNTDLARTLVLHFSEDLVSAKILIPLDDDVPVLGGRTLKVTAGLELAFAEGRPRVVLRGVSLMGVPIPNAWLGGMKNVDLVEEFQGSEGFWRSFAEGVADVRVEEGALLLRLKE